MVVSCCVEGSSTKGGTLITCSLSLFVWQAVKYILYNLLLPHTLWPVFVEHFQHENWTKVSMCNTEVWLQVVSFSSSWMFLVANFQILGSSKLLAFNICCDFNNCLVRKTSYTSKGPKINNWIFLLLCIFECQYLCLLTQKSKYFGSSHWSIDVF